MNNISLAVKYKKENKITRCPVSRYQNHYNCLGTTKYEERSYKATSTYKKLYIKKQR